MELLCVHTGARFKVNDNGARAKLISISLDAPGQNVLLQRGSGKQAIAKIHHLLVSERLSVEEY